MAITEIINHNGAKSFNVYINIRSKTMPHIRLQKRIRGLKTRSEAIRKERLLIKEINSHVAQKEGHGLTWRMVISKWQSFASDSQFMDRPYNPATIKDYVAMMSNWTGSWLDRPASEITKGEGREVLNAVIENGRSKSFQRRLKNTINMIYSWAIEERIVRNIHTSPVYGLKIKVKTEYKPEILNKEEIIHLLKEAKIFDIDWYYIWTVALLTGMRSGELYALKWADVDFSNRFITVQRSFNRRTNELKSTKAGYWRTVPMSSDLEVILKELQHKTTEFVLPKLWQWKIGQQARILKEFCRSIELPSIRFHTLRACFATQLIASGVEPIKVMKICGWRDLKTMAYYVRLAGIDERGATENLGFII